MGQLQALALAISTDGINYFATEVVAPAVAAGIAQMVPPPMQITPSNIPLAGSATANGYWSATAESIVINLSNGQKSNFTPVYQRVSQASNGVFNMYFNVAGFNVSYAWSESYNKVTVRVTDSPMSRHVSTSPVNHHYNYSLKVSSLDILVPLKLATTASGGYSLQVQTVVATPGNITPHVPSGSVIIQNNDYGPCFQSRVASATQKSLENVDFAKPIESDVKPLFATIPDSGKLLSTPSATIVYDYSVGTSALSFPGNQGLTLGVTGQVTLNGTPFSSATVPSVKVPSIPSSSHLAFNLSDYEFNALFWAFYEAGKLATTIVPGDLADPAPLNTSTYAGTYLNPLYSAYPSAPISVSVTADAAPTLTFQQVYCLTSAALKTLASASVPSSVLVPLGHALKNMVFLTQSAFDTKVEHHGGSTVSSYITKIGQAAQTNGTVITHDAKCQFYVNPSNVSKPVAVFQVQFNETDFLSNLQLGLSPSSGTPSTQKQTVQFGFQIIDSLTTAKLLSTNVTGISTGDFGMMWNITLQPEYADVMQAMGKAGVALPFIQGFQFLFDGAVVTVQSGYVDVVTNVEYKG